MKRFLFVAVLILSQIPVVSIFAQGEYQKIKQYDTCIDVLEYQLEINLLNNFKSAESRSFNGYEKITLIIVSLPDSGKIWLHASSKSLKINKVEGQLDLIAQIGDRVYLKIPGEVKTGDTLTAGIYYSHNGSKDEAFYVSKGSVFTNNSPVEARDWFISKDHPIDKAVFSLKLLVPSDVKVGAVGLLEGEYDSLGGKVFHWKSNIPMATYLMVFSASNEYRIENFNTVSKLTGRTIPVELYWRNGESYDAVTYIGQVIPYMLDFFESRFGEYPFEKIAFATLTPDFPYGGMENQSFITLCSGCWYELLVVHEFAHQWFGDLITPSTWSDLWLNEGFAEFMEAYWVEVWAPDGKKAYREVVEEFASYYFTMEPKEAIFEESWEYNTPPGGILYNSALVYKKAACVVYMLREETGDENFFKILKQFTTNSEFKFANASTNDLVNLTNEITGKKYNWFFDQWIKHPGHPVYKNSYDFIEEDGKDYLVYTFTQKESDRLYYQSTVELKVIYKDGTSEIFKCFNSKNGEKFNFEVKPNVKSVIFDPENKIVLKEVK
ncbi:MAG: M1 family metallopeptidase [Ignavibacteriaceae bacterium]|nr:M1 family metallopeptidase [Ignavibacteriaceae bacterium]